MKTFVVYSKDTGACVMAALAAEDLAKALVDLDKRFAGGDPLLKDGRKAKDWALCKEKP